MRPVLPLILLVACGAERALGPDELEALAVAPPRLPAPEAPVYATHLGRPSDAFVSQVLGELPWEEALSGAAGALGVDAAGGHEPDAWSARWAALRAGYPYPIEAFALESVPEGAIGQRVIDGLVQQARPGDHVGLVRVRGGNGDVWVGLIGSPRIALEPVPRGLPVGAELKLEAAGGAGALEIALVSPSGGLETSALFPGWGITLDEEGEYWVEISDGVGVAASFPVSAGTVPDSAPPLAAHHHLASEPEALELSAWELLEAVRVHYGWDPPVGDPILGPVARAHLDDHMGHDGPRSGDFAGEPGSCRGSLSCGLLEGAGVESCFQQWLVDPKARSPLIDPRCSVAGMATGVQDDRLWLQLELGQE